MRSLLPTHKTKLELLCSGHGEFTWLAEKCYDGAEWERKCELSPNLLLKVVRVEDGQVYFNKSKLVRNVPLPVKQSHYCSSKNKPPKGVELKRHVFKLLELAPVEDIMLPQGISVLDLSRQLLYSQDLSRIFGTPEINSTLKRTPVSDMLGNQSKPFNYIASSCTHVVRHPF